MDKNNCLDIIKYQAPYGKYKDIDFNVAFELYRDY